MALKFPYSGANPRLSEIPSKVAHLSTDHIPSDVLTKALDRPAHERHTKVLLGHAKIQWAARDDHVNAMTEKRKRGE